HNNSASLERHEAADTTIPPTSSAASIRHIGSSQRITQSTPATAASSQRLRPRSRSTADNDKDHVSDSDSVSDNDKSSDWGSQSRPPDRRRPRSPSRSPDPALPQTSAVRTRHRALATRQEATGSSELIMGSAPVTETAMPPSLHTRASPAAPARQPKVPQWDPPEVPMPGMPQYCRVQGTRVRMVSPAPVLGKRRSESPVRAGPSSAPPRKRTVQASSRWRSALPSPEL
ncbi:hypothetical protein LTR53_016322, partial [Teratosphaeriaceae sp. CCFEE 6253]